MPDVYTCYIYHIADMSDLYSIFKRKIDNNVLCHVYVVKKADYYICVSSQNQCEFQAISLIRKNWNDFFSSRKKKTTVENVALR